MVLAPIGFLVLVLTIRSAFISPIHHSACFWNVVAGAIRSRTLLHVEHTRLLHGLGGVQAWRFSFPAESKWNSDFVLLGLAGYIHSEEAVGPLLEATGLTCLHPF